MGVVTEAIEERIAKRLWRKFHSESIFASYTPFVIGLASGKLEIETFRHYVEQDLHFLKAFVQAYEKAEDYADDDDAKVAISELQKSVLEELKMHVSFAQEWGIDLSKEDFPDTVTRKYKNFLIATSAGMIEGTIAKMATPFEKTKIAAYIVCAMTPCMRLSAFLGKKLQSLLFSDGSTHPYRKWIENYSSEAFEVSTSKIEELLDKLSISLTGEELEILERLYHQAMKLEIELLSAQPVAPKCVVPLSRTHDSDENHFTIFSDFDLTCTVLDSSAILAEIAIITASKAGQKEIEDASERKLSADLRSSWANLSRQYSEEYEQCIETIAPTGEGQEFDFDGLRDAVSQLSDFERRANMRVSESGVLKGLNLEDIKLAGEHLKLQDGCAGFFKKFVALGLNTEIHVLSYCWCADLIKSTFAAGGLSSLFVHSNEFTYEDSVSTGQIVGTMESPIDKLQVLKETLNNSTKDNNHLSIYIGGSVGDLLCLLEADIGIVFGSSPSLRKVGRQFGVSFIPLYSALIEKQTESVYGNPSSTWKGRSGTLYTVSTWAEIHAFILGS